MNATKKIAFQGEKGAYSEGAVYKYFGNDAQPVPQPQFEDVFDMVTAERCDIGLIPIENSLAGSVHQNYDLLLQHNLFIVGEVILRIVHNLMVLPGVVLDDVRNIYSHPQALGQCDEFIRSLPDVQPVPAYDTAGSAKILVEQNIRDGAAIASRQAAEDYGLTVLKEGIESNHQNYTRFLVLSRTTQRPESGGKTSIVFSMEDNPGILFKCLSVFALREINLLKIESRPLRGQPWNYFFYLDFDGSIEEEHCAKAINHLEEITTFIKVLGSYPRAREA